MEHSVVVRTIVPIFLLMGFGYLAKRTGLMRAGDERVLNTYVYYFALPAFFIVDLSKIEFHANNLRFAIAGIIPIITIVAVYLVLALLLKIRKDMLSLLIVSTVFGSLAFFGIPFMIFAFPNPETELLSVLSAASISVVSVAVSLVVLEFSLMKDPTPRAAVMHLLRKLPRNPLLISIMAGVILSVSRVSIPFPLFRSLHMLGSTTSTVALFLLGSFLGGRTYRNVWLACGLSLLRIVVLPLITLAAAVLFGIGGLERAILVLMNSMPVAVSLIVLSDRYDFHRETIASLVLISSVGAAIHLNLWLWFVNR